jgi:hypothetical protein
MHNVSLKEGARSDKLFKRSVNDSLSLNSYRVWISCKQLEADTSSEVTPVFIGSTVGQNPACWILGPTKASLLTHVFIKPADWIKGKVTYKIHYSADGTGGIFNLNAFVGGVTSDELIPDDSGLIAFTVPEPDAAYKNTVFTPNSDGHYFSIDPEDFNVVLYIGRDGAVVGDSANNLLIYGVELIYRQGRVEFGKPYRPNRL